MNQPENIETTYQQGKALYELGRYPDAEKQLRQVLSREPGHWQAHAYLALSLLSQSSSANPKPAKLSDGLQEARRAVAQKPDHEFPYFVLAWAYLANRKENQALDTVRDGMRINPQSAWVHLISSEVYLRRRQWDKGLAAAEAGLRHYPEMVALLNNRSYALIMLGREKEAQGSIQAALSLNPESDGAHTNRGWLALLQNDHQAALQHFRQALRLDPQSETARRGFLSALQARNPLYRAMLSYSLWSSRLTRSEALVFLFGLSAVNRTLRVLARAFPPLYIILIPWMLIYSLFSFFSWIADGTFYLLLRFSPTGRLLLSKDEIALSNGIGACSLLILLNTIGGLIWWKWGFLVGAVLSLLMMVPVAGTFNVNREARLRRGILAAVTAMLGATAICGQVGAFAMEPWHGVVLALFLIGWFIYPWIANLMVLIK